MNSLLSQSESPLLLSLILNSETTQFGAVHQQFQRAFAPPENRFRACAAALLLLEDPIILRQPQRLVAWYLLSQCNTGANGSTPFLPLLFKAASSPAVAPVERTFLLLLLTRGPDSPWASEVTPSGYAFSCDLGLLQEADWAALQQRVLAGGGPQGLGPAHAEPGPGAGAGAAEGAGQGTGQRPGGHDPLAARAAGAGAAAGAAPPLEPVAGLGQGGLKLQPVAVPQGPGSAAAAAAAAAAPTTLVWERPAPAVMTPLLSELQWLNPDLHRELLWDSSMGEEPASGRQQAAAKELLAAALRGPLLPAQQQLLLGELEADPRVVIRLGLTPAHLPALVENAPVVATEVLLKLMTRWPARAQEFLSTLARSEMSLHSLEVVNRLTATGGVPTEFVHLYITNCIRSCEGTQDKYVQNRLVRLVCVFLQSLIRNKLINIHELLHEVQAFCINFSRIREAAKLFRLLKQIEAGMRGADGSMAMGGEDLDGVGE